MQTLRGQVSTRTTVKSTGRPCVKARASSAVPHVPARKYLDDVPVSQFRNGKPDYTVVNTEYLKNKTRSWAPGSLEDVVESVVKTFEFEISHKTSADLVRSFAPGFTYSMNGGPVIDGAELMNHGSYNVLINDPAYKALNWDFEKSHSEFKTAFPKGFAWEVLEVLNGPPNVSFRWRHWGTMEGPYNGHPATNEVIELFGMAIARVNDQLQIESLEIYYDPTEFLGGLAKGSKCPLGFGSSSSSAAVPATAAAAAAGGQVKEGGGFLGGLMSFFNK